MIYHANESQDNYGEVIGILLLDFKAPFIPGDVGNASTYDYPVRYKLVEGLTFDRLLNKDQTALDILIKAAKELEQSGVKAITADCGFFALFQKEIAEAVDIPVFLSSLLQVPFISSIIGKDKKVGIVSAKADSLDDQSFLKAVNIDRSRVVIKGMEKKENFYKFGVMEEGYLDTEKIEKEVLEVSEKMIAENNEIAAVLIECSMLPPYAKSVQESLSLPVFDFITMIDFVKSALIKREYNGIF
ncbi:MAG: aspartate/glutamate racemase family protein [Bacillota bacterium]